MVEEDALSEHQVLHPFHAIFILVYRQLPSFRSANSPTCHLQEAVVQHTEMSAPLPAHTDHRRTGRQAGRKAAGRRARCLHCNGSPNASLSINQVWQGTDSQVGPHMVDLVVFLSSSWLMGGSRGDRITCR
jgi:hypothetical protein